MIKFKVGDTVRRIKGDYKGMNVGDIDIITEFVKPSLGVRTVRLRNYGKGHSENALELARSAMDAREQRIYKRLCGIKRPRPKGRFKVGDMVRVTDNSELMVGTPDSGFYNTPVRSVIPVGTTAKVTHIDAKYIMIAGCRGGGGDDVMYSPKGFEMAR